MEARKKFYEWALNCSILTVYSFYYFYYRFGRRYVIIFGTILSCLFGTLKAISPNYELFLTFELLDAFFAAGFYNCAVILGKLC